MNSPLYTVRAALLLEILLVTCTAVAVGIFFGFGSTQVFGLMNTNFTAAGVIRERCPFHLVRPEWVAGSDQSEILFRWVIVETEARMAILFFLWALAVSAFLWQYLRWRRREQVR